MKTFECKQGSEEWASLRCAMPTASEMHRLLTPKFKLREGSMPLSYLCQKLAEKWIGGPLIDPSGGAQPWFAKQGQLLEGECLDELQFDWDVDIERPGFITNEAGTIGCSPDGMISGKFGLECKCPSHPVHIAYLLENKVPDDYITQVHTSMTVTGMDCWRFVSYKRMMPRLEIDVPRDKDIQDRITEALDWYWRRFHVCWEYLIEKNGGPPPARSDNSEESYSAWRRSLEAQAEEAARMNDLPTL